VVALSKIGGVVGVVVGTALYEGRVTLEELIRASEAS
jgi:phosphoribosylformimino-5-aminoimidazole carboxamide ribonucleotide (ProFAR) isomerase